MILFNLRQLQKRVVALVPVASSLALMSSTPADAACTPASANDVSAVCTGTTTNQGGGAPGSNAATIGYGTDVETNIAIEVTANSTVAGTDSGFSFYSGSIINQAGASVSGAVGVNAYGQLTFVNYGSVTGSTLYGIYGADGSITNHAGGIITAQAQAVTMGTGTVINSGMINGGTQSGVQAITVDITNNAGGTISSTSGAGVFATTATVLNAGAISGSHGIYTIGTATVTNSGSIAATALNGITAANAVVTNNAGGEIYGYYGINTSGNATVLNYGTVSGTVAVYAALDTTVFNGADGLISGSDVGVEAGAFANVTNAGVIYGAVTSGIYAAGGARISNRANASIVGGVSGIYSGGRASIYNAGTITGTLAGISLGAGDSVVANAGVISGGNAAIMFAGTGNTLHLEQGSLITGQVLGTGSDTFLLGGERNSVFDISQLGTGAQYQGFNTFSKEYRSSWTLTGTSTFDGWIYIKEGSLVVDGDISGAINTTVFNYGTLGGNGIVGQTTIDGGTLSPGNSIGTLTVNGSLTMTAASTYLVEVSGTAADKTIVSDNAVVAGKVSVNSLTRLSATTSYTILSAGTVAGTFDSVTLMNNFARNARLSYVGNDVVLTLDPGQLLPALPGLPTVNQRNVAAGIDNGLANSATTPPGIDALFGLSGDALLNALTQVSGETATGVQQTTVDAMSLFMGVMSDPFTAGRINATPRAAGYAAEHDAYAMFTKAPPAAFAARWNVWAAGFGGSRSTDGNAVIGSGRTTGSIAGGAVGADYWFSPQTLAGFALAGGGTSFSVTGGGSGRSDLFQAGGFLRHTIGSTYLAATAAYGWQDVSTDRTVTLPGTERLRGSFDANAYSGRVEAGHRWSLAALGGVTPYAAAQVTVFDLPAYAETSASGIAGFALAYAAKTVTATRTELGLRGDRSFALTDAMLTLRGRAAWAHDIGTDRNITAAFQSLPGSSFIVNGATPASNTALTSASAELTFVGGLSLAASFEGEFSDVSRSYSGKGVARYAW